MLREQFQRLFASTFQCTFHDGSQGRHAGDGFLIAEKRELWWDPRPGKGKTSRGSHVVLSERFFREATESPVPLDVRVLRALRSPFEIDLYVWLTWRFFRVRKPVTIPWTSLALQLGSGYSSPRHFKRRLLDCLRSVIDYDPEVRLESSPAGLSLKQSPTHVASRQTRRSKTGKRSKGAGTETLSVRSSLSIDRNHSCGYSRYHFSVISLTNHSSMAKPALMSQRFDLEVFLERAPVFSLDELADARGGTEHRATARNQLKRHLKSGRLVAVAREIYARVPPGLDPERFVPDPFLVAFAACPQGVFAYHSALELLGAAHSVWSEHTLHSRLRRSPVRVGSFRIRFLPTPKAIERRRAWALGTTQAPRATRQLVVTGPERTLVEGLRRPELVGGLDELLDSVAGLPLLDFDLLERLLAVYDEKSLWAVTGWLAEKLTETWSTPTRFLDRCRRHRPRQNQYLVRDSRGGRLVQSWRLIVPEHLVGGGGEGAANR